jgi:preprotein translocase subunit SecG
MTSILLIILILVAILLAGFILVQRSEGGGMGGMGGSPAGLMSARGAGDFLTKMTSGLAFLFIFLCILMAGLQSHMHVKTGASLSNKTDVAPVSTTTGNSLLNTAPVAVPGQRDLFATPSSSGQGQPVIPAPQK